MPLIKSGQLAQQTALEAEAAIRASADAAIIATLDQLTQRVNNLSSSTQPAVSRDISRFNSLAYSTSNSSSYSYYGSYNMARLGDGDVSAGMMALPPSTPGQTEGRIYIHVSMLSASFLNAVDLWC